MKNPIIGVLLSALFLSAVVFGVVFALESHCKPKTCKTPGTHRALVNYQCVCVGDEE